MWEMLVYTLGGEVLRYVVEGLTVHDLDRELSRRVIPSLREESDKVPVRLELCGAAETRQRLRVVVCKSVVTLLELRTWSPGLRVMGHSRVVRW